MLSDFTGITNTQDPERPGAMAHPRNILDEIEAEREHQKDKWGTEADLHVNTPMDFCGYIAFHSTRWFGGGFRPYSRQTLQAFRRQMVKVGALALAAIEHVDAILEGHVDRPDVLDPRKAEASIPE